MPQLRVIFNRFAPASENAAAGAAAAADEQPLIELVLTPESLNRLRAGIATATAAGDVRRRLDSVRFDGSSLRLHTEVTGDACPPPVHIEGVRHAGWSRIPEDAAVDCRGDADGRVIRGVARSGASAGHEEHRPVHLPDGQLRVRTIAVDPGNVAVAAVVEGVVEVVVQGGELAGEPPTAERLFDIDGPLSEAQVVEAQERLASATCVVPGATYKIVCGQTLNEDHEVGRRGPGKTTSSPHPTAWPLTPIAR